MGFTVSQSIKHQGTAITIQLRLTQSRRVAGMMRITAHFLLHSALFLSRVWSAQPAAVHRSGKLSAIPPADGYHRSTALANRVDSSAGEQGSAFLTELNALRSHTCVKNPGARGDEAERTKRITGNKPTSLDLTFHMLRELMETSRAERTSQKAKLNKHLLKALGKRSSRLFVL